MSVLSNASNRICSIFIHFLISEKLDLSFISVFTEIMKTDDLGAVEQRFILHWGEMGTQWGINRTVAQVHALLYIWPEPMDADEICEVLNVARSNTSTSLKELQSWGIVRRVHQMGDRRDRFTSEKDVWELARIILHERKKREIDPTLSVLRDCVIEAEQGKTSSPETAQRLRELAEFLELGSSWFEQISKWPHSVVKTMFKLGGGLRKRIKAK